MPSSDDAHKDVQDLLAEHAKSLDSDAHLKILLPQIVSTFGTHKSVIQIIEELKRHQHSADAAGTFLRPWH